uniref:Uncharacterized protein n=1 Tax=Melanopsichium pennsylvanicum 4 TaxID=1398559 RepID=A0A077RAJ2_9BASI|nr:uncharacterized protein BN887_06334 [Melanopsichium pennsylvanicum 4]
MNRKVDVARTKPNHNKRHLTAHDHAAPSFVKTIKYCSDIETEEENVELRSAALESTHLKRHQLDFKNQDVPTPVLSA